MNKQIFTIGSAIALSTASIVSAAAPRAAKAASTLTAQVRVAKFAIANMTCATCPITVRKAMQGVAGVRSVSVDLNTKVATVVFDAGKANIAAIAAASTNAGFPANPAR